MRLFRGLGRVLASMIPASTVSGWDWRIEQTRALVLRKELKFCGEGVVLRPGVMIRSRERVSIGPRSELNDFVHILGGGGVSIGARVLVANHVSIISVTHPSLAASPVDVAAIFGPVVIEDDVWIGAHAVIMPGVTLGKSCVVGAGAVVTKNVAPYAIVAGVPAKLLRTKDIAAGATGQSGAP